MALAHQLTNRPPHASLYEQDYALWLAEAERLLREGRFEEVDAANLAEELAGMGRSERLSLGSHTVVLLQHLLKWQFQPERRGASWEISINNARDAIRDLLKASPSLRPTLAGVVADKYSLARRNATAETRLARGRFPVNCPYGLKDLLDDEFWPGV